MDLSNLDRWYQRDEGEQVGKFKVYGIHLRDDVEQLNLSKKTSSENTSITVRNQ